MKKIILAIFCALSFIACKEDYLDVQQEGQIPAEKLFQTEADAVSATTYIYSFFKKLG